MNLAYIFFYLVTNQFYCRSLEIIYWKQIFEIVYKVTNSSIKFIFIMIYVACFKPSRVLRSGRD